MNSIQEWIVGGWTYIVWIGVESTTQRWHCMYVYSDANNVTRGAVLAQEASEENAVGWKIQTRLRSDSNCIFQLYQGDLI